MEQTKADLIIHPVRLRIMTELVGKQLSPRQLSGLLPDVAQASLYRHIALLLEHGLLEVAGERPINGATERIYRVKEGAGRLTAAEMRAMSRGDHVRHFTVFAASLIDSFTEYMDTCDLDQLSEDGMEYRRAAIWLSDDERAAFAADVEAIIARVLGNPPTPDRRRFDLASVVIPGQKGQSA
jgi:DNA-binding transcriptional ArsR family regulator